MIETRELVSSQTPLEPGAMAKMPRWIKAARGVIRRLPFGRYRFMNAIGRRSMAPFVAELEQDGRVYYFECNLQDGIAREVCFTGMYEPQETFILRQLLRPGQTFVDVGANWGYFTLSAAHQVGPTGRIVSLEPDPRLFPQLQRNVRLNHLVNVLSLQVAAADREGTMTLLGFDDAGENFGVSQLIPNSAPPDRQSFPVRTASLDVLLDELNVLAVDMLKMDIEGAEGLAIRGLERSLRDLRIRRVLLELHPTALTQHGSSAEDILRLLNACGYRCLRIAHDLKTTHLAAYSRRLRLEDILTPVAPGVSLDNWPHLLFFAPGVEVNS